MARNELFEKADELGVEYKKNESTEVIQAKIEEAEIAAKAEGYEKPVKTEDKKEEDKPKTPVTKSGKEVSPILAANRMVRCIITPLAESLKGQSSEMYSVGTSATGFVKKVVVFNRETIEPLIVVKHLKGKTMTMQVDTNTPGVAELKRVPAFNIQVLPDYTEEELEELMAKSK